MKSLAFLAPAASASVPSLRFAARTLAQRAAAIWTTMANRRAIAALATLDDHMLRDIGITRSEVTAVLANPGRVDPSAALADRRDEQRRAERLQARERIRVRQLLEGL